jgi:hypothetical protein
VRRRIIRAFVLKKMAKFFCKKLEAQISFNKRAEKDPVENVNPQVISNFCTYNSTYLN